MYQVVWLVLTRVWPHKTELSTDKSKYITSVWGEKKAIMF